MAIDDQTAAMFTAHRLVLGTLLRRHLAAAEPDLTVEAFADAYMVAAGALDNPEEMHPLRHAVLHELEEIFRTAALSGDQ